MPKFSRSGGDRKPTRKGNSGGSFGKRDRDGDSGYRRERKEGSEGKFGADRKPFKRTGERSFSHKEEKEGRGGFHKEGSEESGRSSYKKSRSFTRNKEIRSGKGSEKRSNFERKGDRDHKRPFKRDYEKRESFASDKFSDNRKRDDEGKRFHKKEAEFRKDRKFGQREEKRPFKKKFGDEDKPRFRHEKGEGYFREKKTHQDKDRYERKKQGKDYDRGERRFSKERNGDKPRFKHEIEDKKESKFAREQKRLRYEDLEEGQGFEGSYDKKSWKIGDKKKSSAGSDSGETRLNKYLAHAGIASRRDADTLIKSGVVKVNGVPVTEMGFKVKPGDKVTYGDSAVKNERKVYLLLNKPKDYISTVDDPQERKTVMDLIAGACKERVYPVGRLDRNTTGLLLLTNDGELTKKLTHPKHNIKKIYHVSLNKGLKPDDFRAIMEGLELEDGPIQADDLAFVGEGKKEVGIEIHSGRNRVVRRLFEHLGYEVEKLDRVSFAGLTKKDLPRGKYRFLNQKEIGFLHMIG